MSTRLPRTDSDSCRLKKAAARGQLRRAPRGVRATRSDSYVPRNPSRAPTPRGLVEGRRLRLACAPRHLAYRGAEEIEEESDRCADDREERLSLRERRVERHGYAERDRERQPLPPDTRARRGRREKIAEPESSEVRGESEGPGDRERAARDICRSNDPEPSQRSAKRSRAAVPRQRRSPARPDGRRVFGAASALAPDCVVESRSSRAVR